MGIKSRIKTGITTSIRTEIAPFTKTRLNLSRGAARKVRAPRAAPSAGGGSRRRFAGARGNSAMRNLVPGQQRCSVRASYISNGTAGHWRQHGVYLEREGAQKEGEKGAGFDRHGPGVSVSARLNDWQALGDERLFKLILSPEFGSRVPLQEFTRDFVKKLEKDLGTKLDWVAVDHYNTDHPHVHIALRGRDELGEALAMHPGYIKEGMRQRAQEGLTDQLGYRTESDEFEAKLREVGLPRYTSLDKEIMRRASPEGELVLTAPRDLMGLRRNGVIRDRLVKLEEMGFAERAGPFNNQWLVHASLEEALRRLSRTKDKQKALAQHKEFILDKHAPLVNTTLKPGGWLAGRVLGSGLDEASDKLYVMLEGVDGKVHYVLHDFKLEGSEPTLVPGRVAVLEYSLEGENQDRALSVAQHSELPEAVLDRLIRTRFFRGQPLEPVAGTLDTFANRARARMLTRFAELRENGTLEKWEAKKAQAATRATSKAFVMGEDEKEFVSEPVVTPRRPTTR